MVGVRFASVVLSSAAFALAAGAVYAQRQPPRRPPPAPRCQELRRHEVTTAHTLTGARTAAADHKLIRCETELPG